MRNQNKRQLQEMTMVRLFIFCLFILLVAGQKACGQPIKKIQIVFSKAQYEGDKIEFEYKSNFIFHLEEGFIGFGGGIEDHMQEIWMYPVIENHKIKGGIQYKCISLTGEVVYVYLFMQSRSVIIHKGNCGKMIKYFTCESIETQ